MSPIWKVTKYHLRNYLRTAYTDERLAWLLAHARSGRLSFQSCCCFVGVPTANHGLRGAILGEVLFYEPHYLDAKRLPGAVQAEIAYESLGWAFYHGPVNIRDMESLRRRRIVPMILAELKRRGSAVAQPETAVLQEA